jgi:serine/threonine protein kinase
MNPEMHNEILCPACNSRFHITAGSTPNFCPFCKEPLQSSTELTERTISKSQDTYTSHTNNSFVTLVPGHTPEESQIQFSIGPYQVLKSIGKGGMGEVLLAYDTQCGRRIALKRIRSDLAEHPQLHNRFLKEARITSQLTHPAIIPIYIIHNEKDAVYYTMPFVEGETLRQILRNAQKKDHKGPKLESSASSIPALIRNYLSVCQAVAYAHSKNVLHRDLKPENIIVGRYGQVLILDWGLAKLTTQDNDSDEIEEETFEEKPVNPLHELTRVGKVVGTVSYMPPERALGQPATVQSDIYSLGIILYQILTLRSPFKRGTLEEFRKNMHKEVLYDPAEVAPYRDVPKVLSRIVLKCLSSIPEERYKNVDELLHDLENYIEGRSEWFQIAKLDINRKKDWEFQENVLIAEHMAITRGTEISAWVNLMISKSSFPENTKIEAKIKIGEQGNGIGFLLSVPEAAERQFLNSGYCLWLGSDLDKTTKLLRATVEVMYAPEIFIKRNEWYQIKIEKIENNIHFYINGVLQFSYISHLPLIGTHIGLLARDADYTISDFGVFIGSQSIKVNCLAVPDAFLAHKDFAMALSEYRRIGYSFPGTAEGREAMFRAGITLLEEARYCSEPKKSQIFEQSLEEFGKLHGTPGAPLEYLGKALVYQTIGDNEEEIKCFELAYRRYPYHPLLPVLQEQLLYRMHESSHGNRKATFHFVLLAMRHLSMEFASKHTKKLFTSLKKHWDPLFFFEDLPYSLNLETSVEVDKDLGLEPHLNEDNDSESKDLIDSSPTTLSKQKLNEKAFCLNFATQLAFWLSLPYYLIEIIEECSQLSHESEIIIGNAIFCLVELGEWEMASQQLQRIKEITPFNESIQLLEMAVASHKDYQGSLKKLIDIIPSISIEKRAARVIFLFMETALSNLQPNVVHQLADQISTAGKDSEIATLIDCYRVWAYLLQNNWDAAGEILHSYPLEHLMQETTPLYFLYGCWLSATEHKEIAMIHFSSILEVAYPRSWTLFSHFFITSPEKLDAWLQKAFRWEKYRLYQQSALFYHCVGDKTLFSHYLALEKHTKESDAELD